MRSGSSVVQYRGNPFFAASLQPKLGPVLVTPTTVMSSWASTASATLLPIVPYPLMATLINPITPQSAAFGDLSPLTALYQHDPCPAGREYTSKHPCRAPLPVRMKTTSTTSEQGGPCARSL